MFTQNATNQQDIDQNNHHDNRQDEALYKQKVGERFASALEAKKLSNAQIVELCEKEGFYIQPPDIAKVKRGKGLTLYKMVRLCEILDIDLDKLLKTSANDTEPAPSDPFFMEAISTTNSRQRLLSSCKDSEVRQMMGTYHCYFFPTNEHDANLLHGKMVIGDTDDASGRCPVHFSFGTGKENEPGKENYKEYNGHVTISTSIKGVYITLKSDNAKLSEISYLVMRDAGTTQERLKWQIALVLTISSDVTDRAPTAHRMLLTKKELSLRQLNLLKGQLYMNATKIYITEENFQKFVVDERMSEEFREEFQSEKAQFPHGKHLCEFLLYDEAWINGNPQLTDKDKMLAITVLREYSTSRRYVKLGSKVEHLLFKLLKLMLEEGASLPSVTSAEDAPFSGL